MRRDIEFAICFIAAAIVVTIILYFTGCHPFAETSYCDN